MKVKPEIKKHKTVFHGGPYSIKKQNDGLLDFSSNINPLGAPNEVKTALKNKIKSLQTYPDSNSTQLRQALQKYTKIPSSQIVVGNGATEIIYNFCRAFLSEKTPVLICIPTFGEYEAAARLNGSKIIYFKTMNLNENWKQFLKKIPKNGCVFVCNPNNPTGSIVSSNKILELINAAKKKSSFVFIDECFIELVPNSNESVLKYINRFDNLFILRSLTKSFGLAGIRIGYGIGSKKVSSILNKIKIPWNVSGFAQEFAKAALNNKSHLKKSNNLIAKESKFLRNQISKLTGYECHETATNFILIKTKKTSKSIQKKLLEKKILIRDASTFRGLNNHHVRISVRKRKENEKLVKLLRKI